MFATEWQESPHILDNLSDCHISELIDGITCCLYSYNGNYHLSTSRTLHLSDNAKVTVEPDEPSMRISNSALSEMFWNVWKQRQYLLPNVIAQRCYIFQFCISSFRFMVHNDHDKIILIASRNMLTCEMCDPDTLQEISLKHNWECVKSYSFASKHILLQAAEDLNPFVSRGFIIYNTKLKQHVKVQSPLYVWFSYGKDMGPVNFTDQSMEEKDMLNLIRINKGNLLRLYFPSFSIMYETL